MYTGYTLDVYAPYTPINTQHRPLVQVLTWILKFYLITCDRSGYFPTYNSTNKVTYFNPTRIKPALRIGRIDLFHPPPRFIIFAVFVTK